MTAEARSRADGKPTQEGESGGPTQGESGAKAGSESRPVGAHVGIKLDRPECVPTGRPPNDPNGFRSEIS